MVQSDLRMGFSRKIEHFTCFTHGLSIRSCRAGGGPGEPNQDQGPETKFSSAPPPRAFPAACLGWCWVLSGSEVVGVCVCLTDVGGWSKGSNIHAEEVLARTPVGETAHMRVAEQAKHLVNQSATAAELVIVDVDSHSLEVFGHINVSNKDIGQLPLGGFRRGPLGRS